MAKRGRPKLEIDPAQVERLGRIHCTVSEMAAVIGCDKRTLERNFAAVIEKGRECGKRSLKRKQYQVAMKGNVAMLIWLGKQHLGQSDKVDSTSTQTRTVTHEHRHTIDYDQLARDLEQSARGGPAANGNGKPVHPHRAHAQAGAVPGVARP